MIFPPVSNQIIRLSFVNINIGVLRLIKQSDCNTLSEEGVMLIVKNIRALVDIRFAGFIEFVMGIRGGSRHSRQKSSLPDNAVFVLCREAVPVKILKELLPRISKPPGQTWKW